MKPRLFPILSAVSLALWLAVAVLFVRSFSVEEGLIRGQWEGTTVPATEITIRVASAGGRVWCDWTRRQSADPEWIARGNAQGTIGIWWKYRAHSISPVGRRDWYRPDYVRYANGASPLTPPFSYYSSIYVAIPSWPLLLILPIPGAICLRRFRRLRRREQLGLCLNCGYDLRATPDRCPECGTVPPSRPVPLS